MGDLNNEKNSSSCNSIPNKNIFLLQQNWNSLKGWRLKLTFFIGYLQGVS